MRHQKLGNIVLNVVGAFAILNLNLIPLRAAQDPRIVRAATIARLEGLQNLEVLYLTHEEQNPPAFLVTKPVEKIGNHTFTRTVGAKTREERFDFLDGRALFQTQPFGQELVDAKAGKSHESALELITSSADRAEALMIGAGTQRPRGSIRNQTELSHWTIDIALGLRQQYTNTWLSRTDLQEMQLDLSNDDEAKLSRLDEKKRTHVWTFDRRLGYALSKYQVLVPPLNQINIESLCEHFEEFGGLRLPMRVTTRILYWQDGKATTTSSFQSEIKNWTLNSVTNTPVKYRIVWPAGCAVLDTRIGETLVIGDKPASLDDHEIESRLAEQKQNQKALLERTQKKIEEIQKNDPKR